ncbi:MAG: hypothetical protein ACLGSA_14025 [Acidobacteriota bacterium]
MSHQGVKPQNMLHPCESTSYRYFRDLVKVRTTGRPALIEGNDPSTEDPGRRTLA